MPAKKPAAPPRLTIARLRELKPLVNMDGLARASGVPVGTLRTKVFRGTELRDSEAERIGAALVSLGITP